MYDKLQFSVIIPVFNREKTISDCLQSILRQTYRYFEIIVVDDNSTDKTCQIVENLATQYSQIQLIKLGKNSGAQVARNIGIKKSTSSWITFLDSDDTWLPNKLEQQYLILKDNNFRDDVVIYSTCYIQQDNKKSYWDLPKFEGYCFRDLLISSGPMFQSLIVSKLSLQDIGLLDENIKSYQEWDVSIALSKNNSFIFMSEPTFIYNIHNGETISKDKLRDVDGYFQVISKYKSQIFKENSKIWDRHLLILLIKCIDFGLMDYANKLIMFINNIILRKEVDIIFKLFGSTVYTTLMIKILLKRQNIFLGISK